jgi:hypothetical protein
MVTDGRVGPAGGTTIREGDMRGPRTRAATIATAIGAGLVLTATATTATAGTTTAKSSAGGHGGQARPANAVLTWNANAGQAAIAACVAPVDNPLDESRAYAMMHLAVHDALNAIDRRFRPYVFDGRAARGASPEAAVAAAAHDVLVPALLAVPAPFPPACGQAGAAV